ncbi:MAG: hypothetical protein LAT65_15260 [Saccharospirillum sp.]|nr:hypothetical protein [Saccharospirillum sp.]
MLEIMFHSHRLVFLVCSVWLNWGWLQRRCCFCSARFGFAAVVRTRYRVGLFEGRCKYIHVSSAILIRPPWMAEVPLLQEQKAALGIDALKQAYPASGACNIGHIQ